MTHRFIRILFFPILAATLMMVLIPADGNAHSTAGRIRVPLDEPKPGIDDVAFFIESHVHRERFQDTHEKPDRRFYVRDFTAIDQTGDKAVVHFTVLDNKTRKVFPDSMTIERGQDGVWEYRQPGKTEPVKLYTYVMKWAYYYQRYVIPAGFTGIGMALLLLFRLRYTRKRLASIPKRKNRPAVPEDSRSTAQPVPEKKVFE